MASASTGANTRADAPTSPAQGFALAGGILLVLVGLAGFLADASFGTGADVSGGSLLGFEVNGWHNLVHIATGALLLSGYRTRERAVTVCLVFAALYAVVTIWGLVSGDHVLWLVPINAADNVLHIGLTLLALAAALVTRRQDDARR
jgi:hypothetical protein